jgi:hypothetical protein
MQPAVVLRHHRELPPHHSTCMFLFFPDLKIEEIAILSLPFSSHQGCNFTHEHGMHACVLLHALLKSTACFFSSFSAPLAS